VHNGLNVWPRLVNFAVNKTLDKLERPGASG
jgi:hypothetical protein